jgi:BMFP domain-containing protein YqiC
MNRHLTPAQAADLRRMLAGLREELDDLAARVGALENRAARRQPGKAEGGNGDPEVV